MIDQSWEIEYYQAIQSGLSIHLIDYEELANKV